MYCSDEGYSVCWTMRERNKEIIFLLVLDVTWPLSTLVKRSNQIFPIQELKYQGANYPKRFSNVDCYAHILCCKAFHELLYTNN